MVTCRFVRADAPQGGDGTAWDRAWTELPDALERGTLYYLAAGTYPGYTFDDPAAGTTPITVVAATVADHGAGAGWDDAYAGIAELGPVVLDAPYHVLDGRGRQIRIRGAFQGTAFVISAGDRDRALARCRRRVRGGRRGPARRWRVHGDGRLGRQRHDRGQRAARRRR